MPEGLIDRARDSGDLIICGRRTPDVDVLVSYAVSRWGPPFAIASDAWARADLETALENARLYPRLVPGRLGPFDGGDDIESTRRLVGERMLTPVRSEYWDWILGRSKVVVNKLGRATPIKADGDDLGGALFLVARLIRREGQELAHPPKLEVIDF